MNGVVVPAHLSHVRFSFYTPEQVRQLSVAQITSPLVFDNFMRPMSGGPNDPRLGPMDNKAGLCATCGMSFDHCPGHFGHIELPVPVYNPLLFKNCATLLRSCCANCFHFCVSPHMKRQLRRRLRLLKKGDVLAALEVAVTDTRSQKERISLDSAHVTTDEPREEGENGEDEDEDEEEEEEEGLQSNGSASYAGRFTSHAQAVFRQTVHDFMVYVDDRNRNSSLRPCELCKACSPNLRMEMTAMKVFRKPLAQKAEAHNRKEGIRLPNLTDLASDQQQRDGARDTEMDDATRSEPHRDVRAPKYDYDDDDEEEEEAGRKTHTRSTHEAYITPMETRAMMRRLWANERSVLELMFSIEDDSKGTQSGDMFYMQTIAVPPNNTRPISRVYGNVFEHSQTSHFVQILKSSLALTSLHSTAREEGKGFDQAQANRVCLTLQSDVKKLIDHSQATQSEDTGGMTGIKQRLEKKEGLFRMNMMGKRVNYAARSVISPDPYIATSEIGIPPYFATRLTFPEPINAHNLESMREAVERGAHEHPGANLIELENGMRVNLAHISESKRKALAKMLFSKVSNGRAQNIKKVHRHIRDGDVVLVNRQPTLHKPGIMAHSARILRGEKTIRMHYANCSTYNADFDGDEMNIHVPQDFHGRAEAYRIMHADQQYLVPTDGKPIRGLIQDHICAAVLLTKRDTFFTKREFTQLVYNSCSGIASGSRPGVTTSKAANMLLCEPAVLKPRQMWTGKQVLSTLIAHITDGMPPMTHTVSTKVPAAFWGTSGADEGKFRVVRNHVVTGVFDKAQFGKFGITHAIHELYGPTASGRFLSALSRLFTYYLQTHGFTCSIEDLFLVRDAEVARAERLQEADIASFDAVKSFMGLTKLGHESKEKEKVHDALVERLRDRPGDEVALDARSTNHLHPISSSVVKACLPSGSRVAFPANGMSLMTSSGAKGSNVNFSQISCLLGQQELEGRRVPRMVSGKTLPSFTPFDVRARAGGFVADRFLSGLRPQEYYFHCMAGREGLVDTAVKTSRSGYLQRCLIKSLESLSVHYDSTVRDCDGSIVQFQYGEDGLDVTKTSFMRQHKFYKDNVSALKANRLVEEAMHETRGKVMPLGLRTELKSFIASERAARPPSSAKAAKRVDKSDAEFEKLMRLHYTHSLIAPGEAVGVLAGQSVGEPSTQMTLNTFHQAGRGEANVTLGIPRLREILMTASRNIATPVMMLPMKAQDETQARRDADKVVAKLQRLTLAEVVAGMSVSEGLIMNGFGKTKQWEKQYIVQIRLFPKEVYREKIRINVDDITNSISSQFLLKLMAVLKKAFKKEMEVIGFQHTDRQTFKAEKYDTKDESDDDAAESDSASGSDDSGDESDEEESDDEEEDQEDVKGQEEKDRQNKYTTGSMFLDDASEEENDDTSEESDSEESDSEESDSEEEEKVRLTNMSKKEHHTEKPEPTYKSCLRKEAVNVFADRVEVDIRCSLGSPKILLLELVERCAMSIMVQSIKGIRKCFIIGGEGTGKPLAVQTDGVNFNAVKELDVYIDTTKITSNDIGAVLDTFGVEAARASIVSEVSSVFGVYGINVDRRHLSLISDHMTFEGGYRAFNRTGVHSNASPLLRMSFETAVAFLTNATLHGETDHLKSPSSRIILGKNVELGTGSFSLLYDGVGPDVNGRC